MITNRFLKCFYRLVGPKTVYLVIIDGGADWVAAESMVCAKFPWISFMHCVGHEGSLIIKDICKIQEVNGNIMRCTDP